MICKEAARLHSAPQAGRFDSTPKPAVMHRPCRCVPFRPPSRLYRTVPAFGPQLACWRWLVEKSSTTASACWRAELAQGAPFHPERLRLDGAAFRLSSPGMAGLKVSLIPPGWRGGEGDGVPSFELLLDQPPQLS
jgi:hypothetical protein